MSDWQPIKTAPQDGTDIIAYPVFGRVGWAWWSKRNRAFVDNDSNVLELTHWMPLPDPPEREEDK